MKDCAVKIFFWVSSPCSPPSSSVFSLSASLSSGSPSTFTLYILSCSWLYGDPSPVNNHCSVLSHHPALVLPRSLTPSLSTLAGNNPPFPPRSALLYSSSLIPSLINAPGNSRHDVLHLFQGRGVPLQCRSVLFCSGGFFSSAVFRSVWRLCSHLLFSFTLYWCLTISHASDPHHPPALHPTPFCFSFPLFTVLYC